MSMLSSSAYSSTMSTQNSIMLRAMPQNVAKHADAPHDLLPTSSSVEKEHARVYRTQLELYHDGIEKSAKASCFGMAGARNRQHGPHLYWWRQSLAVRAVLRAPGQERLLQTRLPRGGNSERKEPLLSSARAQHSMSKPMSSHTRVAFLLIHNGMGGLRQHVRLMGQLTGG